MIGDFLLRLGGVAAIAMLSWAACAHGAEIAPPEEIVVTGEKASRTVQQTPASVAVVTAGDITERNLIDVYDALAQSANVTVPANKQDFSIRGIDAFNVSGGGDDALASVYLDGAPLPQRAVEAGPLDIYDIAQIEIYRGPQSTLQGRNALAGAVIVRTTDPGFTWSGKARLQMTDADGGRRFAAAVGGPIVGDQLAFRLAGEIARADGLIRGISTYSNYSPRRSETIRSKLLYTPAALPGLKIIAGYMHDRHLRGGVYVELDPPYAARDRVTLFDTPSIEVVKSDIATLDASYAFGDRFTLSSVTSYSRFTYDSRYDLDLTAAPNSFGTNHQPTRTITQELRLNFDVGRLQGLVGAYYSDEDKRRARSQATQLLSFADVGLDRLLVAPPPAGFGLPQATADFVTGLYPGGGAQISLRYLLPRQITNKAVFGDASWEFVDGLKLLGGFRWDHESQDRAVDQVITLLSSLPDPASVPIPALRPLIAGINDVILGQVASANAHQPAATVKHSAFLPKGGLTWQITPDASLSGTVQRGYRSGGSGTNVARALYYTYDPEYTWNYELALRTAWFGRRLTINANLFRINWKDQQVTVTLTPGNLYDLQTFNAGSSHLWGFELEAQARPTRTLTLGAGLGYTRTRFTDVRAAPGTEVSIAAGNEFADAPRWTANGSITWKGDNGLFANVNANYRSAAFSSPILQATRDVSARTLVNGRVGWQGDHIGAFLFANNLFDTRYTQLITIAGGRRLGIIGDPRVIGLSLEGRF
jgi:outer membrane receptor protein involved in Fe transport